MLDNLTKQDIIILIGLVALIIITGIICIVISCSEKKKPKKQVKEVKEDKEPDIKMALATDNIPEISEKAPKLEEMFEEENKSVEVPEILEELNEVEKMQDEKNRSSIEDVLKAMNEDLEKQKYENIDRYEEEQEENAVISYKELVERKMALNSEAPVTNVVETLEETSFIEDTPVDYRKIEVSRTDSNSRFTSSEFISPIYGRQENTMEYPTVKKVTEETTYTHPNRTEEELKEETDEFLDSLKKFRSNL